MKKYGVNSISVLAMMVAGSVVSVANAQVGRSSLTVRVVAVHMPSRESTGWQGTASEHGAAYKGLAWLTGGWSGPVGAWNNPTSFIPVLPPYVVTAGQITLSDGPNRFPSWLGVANPTGLFAGEFGNQICWVLRITGNGITQFNFRGLSYVIMSGDSQQLLSQVGSFAGLEPNEDFILLNWGPDRMPGTGDETQVTNGVDLIDEIDFLGIGTALNAANMAGATHQDQLNAAAAYANSHQMPFDITCTYTMHAPGSGTVLGEGAASITVPGCYANCDGSTIAPTLNVMDFVCFMNKFAAGDAYANCDQSTTPPVLNVLDFGCFLNKFAAGCL